MEPHLVHELVHDKRRARHVARILHETDEEIEDEDLGKEHYHGSHTTQDTIHQQGFHGAVGQRR